MQDAQETLLILGAGGHAQVVADAATQCGITALQFCDEGKGESLSEKAQNARYIHVAIGDNAQRLQGYRRAQECGLEPLSIIHPSAYISSRAHVGAGVFVGAFCVINPRAFVKDYALINTAAVIEHDCRVGNAAFVAPGAIMCGASELGDRAFLGTHATMIPETRLGADAVAGAGATIVSNFDEKCCVVGTPARIKESGEPVE